MSRDLRGADVTSSTDEEIIVKMENEGQYRIYPLTDDGLAGFSGPLPPEGSKIRNIETDHVLYRTLSGEIDSIRAVGGDEKAFVEVDRIG
jgi:hypothetical protein